MVPGLVELTEHPLLRADLFLCEFPASLGELPTPPEMLGMFAEQAQVPLHCEPAVRERVRALLRHGGFKPSGRSKPASEYLLKAQQESRLGSINLAVDICNVVSLWSGLPISVVDAHRAQPPYRVGLALSEQRYVFNPSGQELELAGLLCLWDAVGPCGSPVKDSQRTKTDASTRRTLSVIWGEASLASEVARAGAWYRRLLQEAGAVISELPPPIA